MIDHLVGRPNPSWKRTQVFLVILFWIWRIARGNASGPPRIAWLKKANRALQRFTPWQIILSTLTALYAVRNFDKILGLGSPEPLARLYSPSYYRATWISTGLDAGFATAMSIRPKWLRDVCSILFSGYYILYANEGDEKLRRFRAVPTVEMLRTTWEKTTNPYIRALTHLPWVAMRRKVLLPRPKSSQYKRPITAHLFFHPPERELCNATDLVLDFPGGGFVAMSPEHHEERLRMWAVNTGKPILSIDYGKAPEYPYPFAIDEAYDTYKVLVESVGTLVGMSGKKLNIIISGDSAGATLAVNIILKILELNHALSLPFGSTTLPQPVALVLNYAALDFNFTSWMSADNLRVLRSEQSSGNLPGLKELANQKDHLQHISPLSMVKDNRFSLPRSKRLKRRRSWKDTFRGLTTGGEGAPQPISSADPESRNSTSALKAPSSRNPFYSRREKGVTDDKGSLADAESEEDEDYNHRKEEDRPIRARSEFSLEKQQREMLAAVEEANTKATQAVGGNDTVEGSGKGKEPIGTRLTMTSRTGYFQDRIVSPSMMRAMAILYIGPHRNPDFATDYHISPILAPDHLLAQFPPLLLQCGEKDPFVDDTVIFAGRVREAKRARKIELDLTISGKSARFGENLRISGIEPLDANFSLMKNERDKLTKEMEDDWVQMILFSDWSHGYLQMPTLMSEARMVIDDLAEWINVAFSKKADAALDDNRVSKFDAKQSSPQPPGTTTSSETETDDSGITFVPKRYQNGSSSACVDDEPREVLTPSPKLMTPMMESDQNGHTASPCNETEGDSAIEALGPHESDYPSVMRTTPQPPATTKQTGPRQGGTQITETELMRRRRLLDSHIFV